MKKFLVLGMSIGAGAVLAATLLLLAVRFYNTRPHPWNKHALRAVHVKVFGCGPPIDLSAGLVPNAEPKYTVERPGGGNIDYVVLEMDIENTTDRDIWLPKTLNVMRESESSHALSEWTRLGTVSFDTLTACL